MAAGHALCEEPEVVVAAQGHAAPAVEVMVVAFVGHEEVVVVASVGHHSPDDPEVVVAGHAVHPDAQLEVAEH